MFFLLSLINIVMMFRTIKIKNQDYIDKIENLLNHENSKIKFCEDLGLASTSFETNASSETSFLTLDNNIVDIFKSLKDGNEKAFNLFYLKTYKSVYYKLLSYVKNPDYANDLSQDVYIEFYKNAKRVREDKSCLTFLFTIARNIALNYIKSKKEDLEYDDSLNYSGENRENKVDVNIVFAVLLNEIKVKEEDCDILLLHIIQGYSFNEIASIYNANLNTVITKYNRIIKKLQNYFIEKGGSLDAV